MSFWQSELGTLTGKAEDAFTRKFTIIPDGTTAVAKIEAFILIDGNDKKHYEVDWVITQGEFKGQHVFQKIHAFDSDPKKKHRSLNMMMRLYQMYGLEPKTNNPPDDNELKQFIGKYAGLKIQEWSMPKPDGTGMMEGNFISEVHQAANFQCETGKKLEAVYTPPVLDSAFSRNPRGVPPVGLDADLPF